jgi:hypothetical protein
MGEVKASALRAGAVAAMPADGAFNGACRADQTCDAGLACDAASGRCIAAPATAPPAAP